jgi:dienelactone hydrolase
MKRFAIGLYLAIAVLLCNCKSDNQAGQGANAGTRTDAEAAGAVIRAAAKGSTVSFPTSDKVVITGTLYTASGQSGPAVLCLHQWRSDRSTYDALAASLQTAGVTVLTIDLRGHGESRKKSDGSAVQPDRNAIRDLEAAIAFLEGRKEVDKARIGIIGASYGASNALLYAAQHKDVKALVLLSPGLNYFNVLPTEEAIVAYGNRPILLAASDEDLRSAETVKRYQELNGANTVARMLTKAGHGTEMLAADETLASGVVDFLRKNL